MLLEKGKLSRHAIHPLQEEGGDGGRSFQTSMRHEIDNRVVALVADAGQDGQGELGTVGGEEVRVETIQVRRRAASANDDYRVK